MKTLPITITAACLSCITAPIFACADEQELPFEVDEDPHEPGEVAEESVPEVVGLTLKLNGAREPATIDAVSLARLSVEVEAGAELRGVEFYVDGELLAFDVERPYAATWAIEDAGANGPHELAAVAIVGDEAVAGDSLRIDVALPEPGTAMWSLAGAGWKAIAAHAAGVYVLGDDELLSFDEHGELRWQATLDSPATVLGFDRIWHHAVVAGGGEGSVEVARFTALGERLWARSVELPEGAGLVLEDLALFDGRMALTGRRELEGGIVAWATELEVGAAEPTLIWARDFHPEQSAFMGAPAYDGAGGLYLSTNLLEPHPHQQWQRTLEFAKYEGGEKVWSLLDEGAGLRVLAGAAVTPDGVVHLASHDWLGGRVSRFDAEGVWLGSNDDIGSAVPRIAASKRGVVWAGRGLDDALAVGRIDLGGDLAWRAAVTPASAAEPRDLSVDGRGYVYVLSEAAGVSRVHKLHP
jgi:hypothetical protein